MATLLEELTVAVSNLEGLIADAEDRYDDEDDYNDAVDDAQVEFIEWAKETVARWEDAK